jgi:hypothetical protein
LKAARAIQHPKTLFNHERSNFLSEAVLVMVDGQI